MKMQSLTIQNLSSLTKTSLWFKSVSFTSALVALFAVLPSAGDGQTGSTEPITQNYPQDLLLHEGTPVRMRINRTVSSADAHVDDNVDFETLDDVKVGDLVVIPKGSMAMATVTEAASKRRMGRGGKLNMNIDYVRLPNGEKLALRGVQDSQGGGHAGAMAGAMVATSIVFFPAAPLFLFMHGKDITIPKGHEVTVYTNTDFDTTRLRLLANAPALTTPPAAADPRAAAMPPAAAFSPVAAPANEGRSLSGSPAARLTNADIVKLKEAGVGEALIVDTINASGADYRLEIGDIVELKRAGLSDAVIGAMLKASQR